ncbi:MAG: hypothetical protein A3G25_11420 [Betaproteobacteria bacterium RIFCSPLOWO2_12_FULL_63_13]|nr:MAG: hypothetical protein A3G25_11420 [Betaproteobacteria bacterium RIFCSPLOWO2_12_FULL_63_13]
MLERLGCDVLGVAASGADALRYFEELQPDLVLMDIDLVGPIEGFDLVVTCRAIGPVALVFVATQPDEETIARMQAIPSAAYLIKPVDDAQLGGAIQRVLRRPEEPAVSSDLVSPTADRSFDQLFQVAADSMLIIGADGRIERVNSEFEQRFRYAAAAVVGQTVEMLLPEAARTAHVRHRKGFTEHPQVRRMGERRTLSARAADGKEFPVEVSLAPIGAGADAKVIVIVRDASEHRWLEQAQRERQALEEQLGRVLRLETVGRLAGGIAHDFNNLLMVVGGYTDVLLNERCDPVKTRRLLQGIRATTNRAAELTHQLLAFGRRQVLQPRTVDVSARLEAMRALLARVIGEEIDVILTADAALRPVRVDVSQLEQVVLNLALNARDAMPGGGTLTIEARDMQVHDSMFLPSSAEAIVSPGDYVRLAVRDTGSGMDAAVAARAFEPFFTTKGTGKGIGMGLASVYGIVKQSGGFVWIESELGRGTTVCVLLPAANGEADEGAELAPAATTASSGTILLVEDEPDVRALLIDTLLSAGYKVIEAANGRAALDIFRDVGHRVDLIVSDVIMPQCGGPELVRAVRGLRPGLPSILMSGYATDGQALEIRSDAITRFIQKPFGAETLCRTIVELLGAGSTKSENALANF